MKRLLIIFLIVAIVVSSFASCMSAPSNDGDSSKKDKNENKKDEDDVEDVDTEEEEFSNDDEQSDSVDLEDDSAEEDIDSSETESSNDDIDSSDTEKNTESETESKKETEKETEKPTFNVKESTAGLKFELNPDGLSYTLVDRGTASKTAEIVIDGHKGLPVTKIGYGVFDNSVRKDTAITKVTIGDYVEEIDDYAFSHCSKITSIKMGSGVKVIGLGAFRYCSALTSISLSKSLEYIDDSAFYKSTKLASITIPNTVKYIGDYAFDTTAYYDTTGNWVKNALYIGNHLIALKTDSTGTVNVKDGTITIACNALDSCTKVTKVVIPNSVKYIGAEAFTGCTALATVTMGTGIESCGENAFYKTKFYNTSANWTNNVLYAGKCLIAARTSLSGTYTVQAGTTVIADCAFAGCESLSAVNMSSELKTIGQYAFMGCTNLSSVTIKSAIKTIKPRAFKNCVKLTSVTLPSYTGWKVDGEAITDALATKTDAAVLLGSLLADKTWTK